MSMGIFKWDSSVDGESPYSLGKLVDWKLEPVRQRVHPTKTPYSLGKLVDWKQDL